jgi:hypothetical protein
MLESIPAPQTAPAAVHVVAAATQGNPLAAVELYTCLLERQTEGKYALPVPLPCRGSFESEFAATVAGLTQDARQVLDLLSLSCRSDIATLEKVYSQLWPGIDELLATGIISRTGPHLRIQDQLLRGYVFAAMTPALRTANHRAMAEAAPMPGGGTSALPLWSGRRRSASSGSPLTSSAAGKSPSPSNTLNVPSPSTLGSLRQLPASPLQPKCCSTGLSLSTPSVTWPGRNG